MNAPDNLTRKIMILIIDPGERKWEPGIFAPVGPCDVVRAADPAEGVGHFVYSSFDASILSLNDRAQCLNILRFFKSVRPSPPIVVISDNPSGDFILSALRADAWDIFREPADPVDVANSVRQALHFHDADRHVSENQEPVWKALRYIHEHLMEHFTLEETAQKCGMSVSCFQRAFKREVGSTFNKYVNMHRIAKARQLLLDDRRSMSEIAFDCGFTNQYHFTRTFKKLMNTPPKSFRKSLAQQPFSKTIPA